MQAVSDTTGAGGLNDRAVAAPAEKTMAREKRLVWVAAGLLPLCMFGAVMLLAFKHQQDLAIEHALRDAAGGAAHLVERAVREQIGILKGMAASLAFDRGDLETVRKEAGRLWELHPEWRTVIVTDEHRPLLNLHIPPGEALTPLRDPESLARVWATGRPLAGNLAHGYVGIRVPVMRDGRMHYTLVVPTSTQYFSDQLREVTEGQPWTAAVIGSDGVLIVATPGSATLAGKPLPWPIPQSAQGFLAEGADYLAWSPVEQSGWQVVVTAPAAAIEQPYAQTRRVVYVGGALAAILTAVLVLVLSSAWASRREAVRLRSEIEDRRKTEALLRESRERYRLVADFTYDWEYWVDPSGKLIYVSPSCERVSGYPPSFFLEDPAALLKIAHPADRSSLESHLSEVVANVSKEGTPCELKFRIIRADGQTRWVLHTCWSVFTEVGDYAGRRGSQRDITENNIAQQTLRESEERNRRLIEASPDAILVRSDGLITYANPAALKLLGAASERDLLGKAYLDLVHPDDRTESAERVRKSIEEGLVAPVREHRLLALDGRVVEVESVGVPAKFQGGIQTFGLFRDIRERKKAYQDRVKLESQLQQAQKMESLGTLAGGIAHDFNNILGVIIGSSELLAMTNAVEASSRDTLDNILAASQRARELVRQILAFSRHAKQEKILLNLKPIIKETFEFLRASLPVTIELRQQLDLKAGTIMADPTQMQQILMNLCTTAAHAMERTGGVLNVQLSNVVLNQDDVRFDPELEPGGYVRLAVSDTGHGIAPEALQRIFDPYFTTKEKGKGTGLGLAVVHGIVKAHGGAIKVYSEVGQGTTFQVLLPSVEGYSAAEGADAPALRGGSERILLVDDEKGLADIEKRMLDLLGYEVEIRTSPLDALEAFRAGPEKFDLVITDLTMPQMTGMKLAKQMVQIRPGMPIILCTGFSDQIDERRTAEAGIQTFLLKPLVANELAEAVRNALDKRRTG